MAASKGRVLLTMLAGLALLAAFTIPLLAVDPPLPPTPSALPGDVLREFDERVFPVTVTIGPAHARPKVTESEARDIARTLLGNKMDGKGVATRLVHYKGRSDDRDTWILTIDGVTISRSTPPPPAGKTIYERAYVFVDAQTGEVWQATSGTVARP